MLALAQSKEAPTMAQDLRDGQADLEQLRQQLTEFRSTQPVRSRLPEPLWAGATELATRYGVHRIARELHLDYTGLKKRVAQRERSKPKPATSVTPTFVEWDPPRRSLPVASKSSPRAASCASSCHGPHRVSSSTPHFSWPVSSCCRSRRRHLRWFCQEEQPS